MQDKNIDISIEPDFYLSYYESEEDVNDQIFFLKSLEDFNSKAKGQKLFLENNNLALTRDEISSEFIAIDALSSALEQKDDAQLFFARALHYSLVKNFSDALNDLDKAIKMEPKNELMLYARASVRQKMVDFIRSIEAEEQLIVENDKNNDILNQQGNSRIIDYDLMVSDYNKVLSLNPKFAHAAYNKGNVMMVLKNYRAAISDYTYAIKIEPNFAEAYYNRGLNYIFLGENEKGLKDLSKAGELGIYKVYNVMKRYGN